MLELAPRFWERTRARLDLDQLALELGAITVPDEPLDTSATPEQKTTSRRLRMHPRKTAHGVAAELGLTASAVSTWVTRAKVDARPGGTGALTTAERDELSALRREAKTLR